MVLWRRGMLTIQWVIVAGLIVGVPRTADAHDAWRPTSDPGLFGPAEPSGPVRKAVPRAFRGLFEPDPAQPLPKSVRPGRAPALSLSKAATFAAAPATQASVPKGSIAWRSLLTQSLTFLVVQHAWRMTFEDGTYDETVRGPFFDDWFKSASTLCCWDDGDKFSTNYLFHPLMGSTTSFIFANNHRASQDTPIGKSSRYWKAKGAQGIYSFVYGVAFELGPLSEASIGNVGMKPGQMTFVDFVVTPGIGLLFSVAEDAARLHIIDRVMRQNRYWGNTLAVLLNPTRSVANVIGGKRPWRGPAWSQARQTH